MIIERDAQIDVPAKVCSHVVRWVVYLYLQEESHYITALGLACECGHKSVAELLILQGAKVNYQDNVRLSKLLRVLRYSIIISVWFHTTPLGKSEWSLGCGRIINYKRCTNSYTL